MLLAIANSDWNKGPIGETHNPYRLFQGNLNPQCLAPFTTLRLESWVGARC
jgi:hypothetical protein